MIEILNYLIQGFLDNINVIFFLLLLISGEFAKTFVLPLSFLQKPRRYLEKKKISFTKYFILLWGVVIGLPAFYIDVAAGKTCYDAFVRILFTYAFTTSFYELLFSVLIVKFKDVLLAVAGAKIKPIEIDVNQNNSYGYIDPMAPADGEENN